MANRPKCDCTQFFYDCGKARILWSEALTCHINGSTSAAFKYVTYLAHKQAAKEDTLGGRDDSKRSG